jgi:hypothetical protein
VHYERLGYVVAGTVAMTVALMFQLNRMVIARAPAVAPGPAVGA